MRLVVFGLSVTSSWGNGHATVWRGLIRALAERGHAITFFERAMPWYAAHRDLETLVGGELVLYDVWPADVARVAVEAADAFIVTSYCPDARVASILTGPGLRVFYDLDTPVTLAHLETGGEVEYLRPEGLRDFDLVLSVTGGAALTALTVRLGARCVAPLYRGVDMSVYRPGAPVARYAAALSHLGAYAADRFGALQRLFLEPARRRRDEAFLLAGSLYPPMLELPENVAHVRHVEPGGHADLYASSRFMLNLTRGAMTRLGFCPSARLFEAAACGAAIISDWWRGFEHFFTPGLQVLIAASTGDVLDALAWPEARRRALGDAARARVITAHTSRHRADELEQALLAAKAPGSSLAHEGHVDGRAGEEQRTPLEHRRR